jgi:hypothetical protein
MRTAAAVSGAALLLLAGCGGDGGDSSNVQPTPRAALAAYARALKAEDGKTACSLMTPEMRKASSGMIGGRSVSCEEAAAMVGRAQKMLRLKPKFRAAKLKERGDVAVWKVAFVDPPIWAIYTLKRSGDGWYIAKIR